MAKFVWVCGAYILFSTAAMGAEVCDLSSYSPFGRELDYRDPANEKELENIEKHHFTQNVELLLKGVSAGIGADISYTLKAFPNHYRALNALVQLSLKEKVGKPREADFTIDCFFKRAINFRPDDSTVRMIYGVYLYKTRKLDEALIHMKKGADLDPLNANINYNLGLLYFEKKEYEKARSYAKKAYDRGFLLQGLRNKLRTVGKW
jgi:tetratricopeptide (TPR) repeat protein